MPLIQCKKCEKAFDTDLIPPGSPLLCVYCGFDNGGAFQGASMTPPALPSDGLSLASGTGAGFSGSSFEETQTVVSGERVACDWELNWRSSPVSAYVNTMRSVLTSPIKYFATVKPFDDYMGLAAFIYINSFIMFAAMLAFQMLVGFAPMMLSKEFDAATGAMGLGFGLCAAFVLPFLSIFGLVIGAGIMHFFFRMIGGSQKNFDTTFTVYGLGSAAQIFAIVPVLGGLANMVYSFIINIGGQAEAHEIPPSKAFLSFLVPTLICCCAIGAFYTIVIGGLIASGN